jgi:hypothetical protein
MSMRTFATLKQLKRHAKKVKRETGISHSQALENTAKDAGFRDYRDAQKTLPTGGAA